MKVNEALAPALHEIPPVYDKNSRILILGSFPSVKSREIGFFYGHPQNRFWPLLAALTGEPLPVREDIAAKKQLLLRHGLALWDTLESCTITGASDASIRDVVPNDISMILEKTQITTIFTNGGKAHSLYEKYMYLHKISAAAYRHPGCPSAQYKPRQRCLQPRPAGGDLGRCAGGLDRKMMTRL